MKIIRIFLSLCSIVFSSALDYDLTSSNLCDTCECGPGPGMNPRERAMCHNLGEGKRIRIVSLPHFVTSLEISNSSGGVNVLRGAIRVEAKFNLHVRNTSHVELSEKSLTLLTPESVAVVSLDSVDNVGIHVKVVSASKPGRFKLFLTHCGTVSIESKAFDVLSEVRVNSVKTLRISSSAFKPNLPIESPELEIHFDDIGSIPALPTDAFSSALTITISDSSISEIESGSFSGFSMINVTFSRTNIDRIHMRAFPEKSLINRLLFDNCTIISVGDKAISSAISSLEMRNSTVSSLSQEAISSHVAKVEFVDNLFQTLSHRSFVFQMWTAIVFAGNRINFMESGALEGIHLPGESEDGGEVSLIFNSNHIHYANQNALKIGVPSTVNATAKHNVFYKSCDCSIIQWLQVVCGSGERVDSLLDFASLVEESSLCQVPDMARPCFRAALVPISEYLEKFCEQTEFDKSADDNLPACMMINQATIWEMIYQYVEVNTNRGILILLLVFAFTASLIVALLTLIRWIIWLITSQTKRHNKSQEWNFTKVEERCLDKAGSDHYENVPLTGGDLQGEAEDAPTVLSIESDVEEEVEPPVDSRPQSETTHTTLEAERTKSPPKPTFYDEMINFLQEKLEDPNNYGTVADSQTTCFYQDPHDHLSKL